MNQTNQLKFRKRKKNENLKTEKKYTKKNMNSANNEDGNKQVGVYNACEQNWLKGFFHSDFSDSLFHKRKNTTDSGSTTGYCK